MKEILRALFGSGIRIALTLVFMFFGTLGWAYWMWVAIKANSFGMFFFGLLVPFAAVGISSCSSVCSIWQRRAGARPYRSLNQIP